MHHVTICHVTVENPIGYSPSSSMIHFRYHDIASHVYRSTNHHKIHERGSVLLYAGLSLSALWENNWFMDKSQWAGTLMLKYLLRSNHVYRSVYRVCPERLLFVQTRFRKKWATACCKLWLFDLSYVFITNIGNIYPEYNSNMENCQY